MIVTRFYLRGKTYKSLWHMLKYLRNGEEAQMLQDGRLIAYIGRDANGMAYRRLV